jgi:hypothetical protein
MITVVLTSCGRLDLLKRALESFYKFNTAISEISEFIIVDDSGNKDVHNELRRLYSNYTLILEPVNRGQIVCIDDAYSRVKTSYIFHTEDDFEFCKYGFIEDSMAILEQNDKILNVWLLGLKNTNGHPVEDGIYKAGNIEYRLLRTHFASSVGNLEWHGFSLTPSLRRFSDYKLVASFSNIVKDYPRHQFRIFECLIGEAYFKMNYRGAILIEPYLFHTGSGRSTQGAS